MILWLLAALAISIGAAWAFSIYAFGIAFLATFVLPIVWLVREKGRSEHRKDDARGYWRPSRW